MRPIRTHTCTIAALLALAATGCFSSHNPGYFPYYWPGGRIQQEHAKPRGFGYFRDFDPKACRLEVTPSGTATAPLGAQLVLVATVSDKTGQPRRSRRVEWMIEGPGSIIEVDEAGLYAGRGYKVDNKYAVSYTDYTSHTITRGNDDPKDDVAICPGQTFCVVSSAVPGETTVTAYAPGVFNWDNGRVVTKIVWGDGRFSFPQPAVVRFGSELTLTTTVNRLEQDGPAPLPNYRVRYRILPTADSPTAVLVPRGGTGTTATQSGADATESEAPIDGSGSAAVRLVSREAKAGKTRVRVEVIKPAENGAGPGTVVGTRETLVEWAAPEVRLDVTAPSAASPTHDIPVSVSLMNTGHVDSRNVRIRVTLSAGATLSHSEPPPVKQDEGGGYIFDLPPVANGKKQEVVLAVKPGTASPVTVHAEAVTADGLRAENSAVTRVESGRLQVLVEVPPTALASAKIPARISVTNTGLVPVENATVWAQFDRSLAHATGENPVQLTAGTVAPGETKVLDLPLTATTTGRFTVQASVTADGNISARSDPVAVAVRRAELSLAVTGPQLVYVNQDFTWTLAVGNPGDAAVANVTVRATLPPEAKLKDPGEATIGLGSVEWRIPELKPGEQRACKLTLAAVSLADRAAISATAFGNAAAGREPVEAKAVAVVAVVGVPAVVLELATPAGTLDVGKRATFQVRVQNRGTVSARGIEVTAFAPPELKPIRGTGNGDARIGPDGKLVFPPLDELRPGQTAVLTIEVEAAKPGDARFRAEVRAAHLTNALREEQSLRVLGGQ